MSLAVPAPSPDLVARHAGRVLRPEHAVLAPGSRPPSATAYRANTLLIPEEVLQNQDDVAAIKLALRPVGLTIEVPKPIAQSPTLKAWAAELRGLPRAAVLRVREGAQPSLVDAWIALQALRAAAGPSHTVDVKDTTSVLAVADPMDVADAADTTASTQTWVNTLRKFVSRITLDHLLQSADIVIRGEPGSTDGNSDDPQAAVGAQFYATSRIPVKVLSDAPPRTRLSELSAARRPVVAVLDTGVRRHPWLGEPDAGPDPFLSTDSTIQSTIEVESSRVRDAGDLDIPVLAGHHDEPDESGPTVGLLDSDIGHGIFIAGVIQQIVPDARVRMIRVMHTDGFVQEQVLVLALWLLSAQVAAADASGGDTVDIVSLSLGYFDENPTGEYTSHVADAIGLLNGLGVAVVAAAGNDATVQPCYPAALATAPNRDPQLPVVSVGALNPNGTKAIYSNDGPWVTAWAVGSDVISTYPVDLDGSERPLVAPSPPSSPLQLRRETLDPDGFRGGFAVWSGTSFAAPVVAANLAATLLELAEEKFSDPVYNLSDSTPFAARTRMADAFKRIGL